MLVTPSSYTLVSGSGEGRCNLTAFDAALLNAGAGNINLLKVSSILPPGAVFLEEMAIPPGSLVPTAYGSITSDFPGEEIAVAVAVGLPVGNAFGIIMEHGGRGRGKEIEEEVRLMVEEAFRKRKMPLKEIRSRAAAHRVTHLGCAFAGVILWY